MGWIMGNKHLGCNPQAEQHLLTCNHTHASLNASECAQVRSGCSVCGLQTFVLMHSVQLEVNGHHSRHFVLLGS